MNNSNLQTNWFTKMLKAPVLAGIVGIIGLVLVLVQIGQAERDAEDGDSANATLVAVLEAQLQVQSEIATVQTAAVNPNANATFTAQRLIELESEFEELELTKTTLGDTSVNEELSLREPTPLPPSSTPITHDPFYDSFEDNAFNGTINGNLWKYWSDTDPHLFSQQIGFLKLNGTASASLVATKHIDLLVRVPMYYEARFMLNSADGGSITLKLHAQLSDDKWWATQCGIVAPAANAPGWAFCDYGYQGSPGHYTDGVDVEFSSWHTFRIEINPEQQTVTYFIDGESKSNIILPEISSAKFSLVISGFTSQGTTIGYVDDVIYDSIE